MRAAIAPLLRPNRPAPTLCLMRMTQAIYIGAALLIGFGSAVQVGMIGSLGRQRGAFEATLISMLASVLGLAAFLVIRALRSEPPQLPSPMNEPLVYVVLGGVATVALVVSMRGLQPYLSAAGLFGFLYVVSAAFLAPRIGIALYVSAVTAGTLIGSVALDHLGAFGAEMQRVTLVRGLGLLALILGVVLVRGR